MRKRVILIALVVGSYACKEVTRTGFEEYLTEDSLLVRRQFLDGNLVSEIKYSSDGIKKQGRALYYNKGRLVKSLFYNNDKITGSHVEYFSNSKPSLFICHDSYGDTVFIRMYDEYGKIIYQQGDMYPHGFLSIRELEKNKMVKYNSFIVKPPQTSVKVLNFYLRNGSNDTLWPVAIRKQYEWIYSYFFKIPESGDYEYKQITIIEDSILEKQYIVTDSLKSTFRW